MLRVKCLPFPKYKNFNIYSRTHCALEEQGSLLHILTLIHTYISYDNVPIETACTLLSKGDYFGNLETQKL